MRITISNFRGIKAADITVSPIAMIGGGNGQGKTSIARAAAAVLTGETHPYEDVLQKETTLMINYDASEAEARLFIDAVTDATVNWKAGGAKYMATGAAPAISKIAAGITDPLAMPAKELGAILIALLDAEPTFDDVKKYLSERGASAEVIESVWETVKKNGWDAANKRAKETGTRLKAQWEVITNDRYGDKKAEDWRPAMFDISPGKEGLERVLMDSQDKLEKLLMSNAVSQSERDGIAAKAEQADAAAQKVEDAKLLESDAKAAYDKAKQELDEFPDVKDEIKTVPCPSCNTQLVIRAQHLSLPPEKSHHGEELRKLRLKHAGLCGTVSRYEGELSTAKLAVRKAEAELKECQDAQAKLLTLPQADGRHELLVAEARKNVQNSRDRLTACENAETARALHGKIQVNAVIIEATGDNGLRKQKMLNTIQRFYDDILDPICLNLGIMELVLDENMNLSCGGTPYKMLSQSEQFRTRMAMQIAIAKLEKAACIIVDGADVVIAPDMRGAMIATLVDSGIPAILCMAVTSADKIPNLAASGHGMSYWVEAGQCTPLA